MGVRTSWSDLNMLSLRCYQTSGEICFFFLLCLHFLLIYFWLHCVCIAVCRLSLGAMSGSFSLRWLLLLWTIGSRCTGFSSCSTWAQWLWHMGLVAPRHVKSFWTRDQTHVPCTGRQILNHWTTREILDCAFDDESKKCWPNPSSSQVSPTILSEVLQFLALSLFSKLTFIYGWDKNLKYCF